jgi:hypothetical protein
VRGAKAKPPPFGRDVLMLRAYPQGRFTMSLRVSLFGWLASLLVIVLIVAAGCGRSDLGLDNGADSGSDVEAGACNSANCPTGCCDANGACQIGSTSTACGAGGEACTSCQAGFSCSASTRTCTVGGCGPATCPNGCCDGSGNCRAGTDVQTCGRFGASCENCVSLGFDACDPNTHVCETPLKNCNPQTCPTGCCQPGGGAFLCISGRDSAACGTGGEACEDCLTRGQVCDPSQQACVTPQCGPGNCTGCCLGNTCVPGNSEFACGVGGGQCNNCGLNALCTGGVCQTSTCNPQTCPQGCCDANGACQPGNGTNACGQGGQICQFCPPNSTCQFGFCQAQGCGPMTCPGCCNGQICLSGNDTGECGQFGQQCQNCSALGDTCQMGVCQPPPVCDPSTCPGCCDSSSICHGGFVDNRCGSGGVTCVDCTLNNDTCDTQVVPRVCTKQQTTCPSPYGSCPPGTTTVAPPVTPTCPQADLQDAAAACASGALSPACASFFQTEAQINPACAKCLTPFDVSLFDGTGIFLCVAPFVDSTCNGETGCATDCETQSCSQCQPNQVPACHSNVEMGQCMPYFQPELSTNPPGCVIVALEGAASFCNPQNYGFNFGQWLEGAGGHYCGM